MKPMIEPLRLEAMLLAGKPVDVIDVRSPSEFASVHLSGARSEPLEGFSPQRVLLHRKGQSTEPLYIMSERNRRAGEAVAKLAKAGFPNAVVVTGGLAACEKSGMYVVHKRSFTARCLGFRHWLMSAVFVATVSAGLIWGIPFLVVLGLVLPIQLFIFWHLPRLTEKRAQPASNISFMRKAAPFCPATLQSIKSHHFVKRRAIALFSGDGELQNKLMTAVLGSQRGLRLASNQEEALRILQRDVSDLDMVIVDLDLDAEGGAFLDSLLSGCERIPVVAVSGSKKAGPIPTKNGLVACLSKPVTAQKLSSVIEQFTDRQNCFTPEFIGPIDRLGPGLWTEFSDDLALSA